MERFGMSGVTTAAKKRPGLQIFRRLLCLLLCFALFPCVRASAEEQDVPAAKRLKFTLSGLSGNTKGLHDGKQGTSVPVPAGAVITLKASEPIGSLYILWDAEPLEWTLTAGGETVLCGTMGFRHEFVTLPQPAETVKISLSKAAPIRINEISAYSPGTPPANVQVWDPPTDRADILVIPTHSDDEFIYFGGILPYYAGELGLDVQVMYMINHQKTQRVRNHELLNGLWTAGVRWYPVVNNAKDLFIKSRKEAADTYESRFLLAQVREIRRCKPLVIVGHDVNGEYHNQVHIQNALCLQKAVELAADASFDPSSAESYGTWDTPKLYLHLYGPKSERTVLDYSIPLEAFGGKTAFQIAKKAFACHKSQKSLGYKVYGAGTSYDSRSFGLFRSLVGPDENRNDLMEHIVPEDWRG